MNRISAFKSNTLLFFEKYKFKVSMAFGLLTWIAVLRFAEVILSPFVRLLLLYSFAVLFLGFALAFSQLIAAPISFSLNTYLYDRRHRPEETSFPELFEVSRKMGYPYSKNIKLTDNPNVKSAYTNMASDVITLPRSWKDKYTLEQLLSILAHEVAHLKTKRRSYIDMILVMLGVTGTTLYFGLFLPSIFAQIAGLVTFYLLLIIALRTNEFRADEEAAKIVGPDNLISVFKDFESDEEFSGGSESHPPPDKRIKRLRRLFGPDSEE